MAVSPDGEVLAVGTGDGRVWLCDMTHPTRPFPLGSPVTGPAHDVDSVTFGPDGTVLAASSGDAVWRWRFADPAQPAPPILVAPLLTGPTHPIGTVVFSRDGHTLMTGDTGNQIWRWSITDPAHRARWAPAAGRLPAPWACWPSARSRTYWPPPTGTAGYCCGTWPIRLTRSRSANR